MYSGKSGPFGPTSFLATTWKASSAELSGYAQQDAHEFFMSALNLIHQTSKGKTAASCICIVHSTFDGTLQSDVRCERCGNVNSTPEPMFDISLEVNGKGSAAGQDVTLESCLRKCVFCLGGIRRNLTSFLLRYTQPEKLGTMYTCSKCSKASNVCRVALNLTESVLIVDRRQVND